MPKYEYPEHIYQGGDNSTAAKESSLLIAGTNEIISTSAEDRRAFLGEGSESSSEEESEGEDLDFFSNAEFLGTRDT